MTNKPKQRRMNFVLPEPKAKETKPTTDENVLEGPFEETTRAGRRIVWAITESPVYGKLYRVNPENKQPLAMGESKADIWECVFTSAVRRNV